MNDCGGLTGRVGEACTDEAFGGILAISLVVDRGSSGRELGERAQELERPESAGGEPAGVVIREDDDVGAVLDVVAELVERVRVGGGRIRRCTVTVTLPDVEAGGGGRIASLGLARTRVVLPAAGVTREVYKVF